MKKINYYCAKNKYRHLKCSTRHTSLPVPLPSTHRQRNNSQSCQSRSTLYNHQGCSPLSCKILTDNSHKNVPAHSACRNTLHLPVNSCILNSVCKEILIFLYLSITLYIRMSFPKAVRSHLNHHFFPFIYERNIYKNIAHL